MDRDDLEKRVSNFQTVLRQLEISIYEATRLSEALLTDVTKREHLLNLAKAELYRLTRLDVVPMVEWYKVKNLVEENQDLLDGKKAELARTQRAADAHKRGMAHVQEELAKARQALDECGQVVVLFPRG